jgi:hypothetical protein
MEAKEGHEEPHDSDIASETVSENIPNRNTAAATCSSLMIFQLQRVRVNSEDGGSMR